MKLLALADFNLVAAHGGFGRASRATGRPKATLSRRVAELEAELGLQLIERGSRSFRLTEAGLNLESQAGRLLAQLDALGEMISECVETPRGRLRISAPVVFTTIALSRIAAEFVKTYPEVEVEIIADERYVAPIEEGFDVVIRANPAPDEHLVGRLILRDERLIVASPDMEKPTWATTGVNSASVNAVVMATSSPTAEVWLLRNTPGRGIHPRPVLRLSSLLMVREAIRAGAGIGILPRMLVSEDLKSGTLTSWGAVDGGAIEMWALHSSGRRASAKIRMFLDFLCKEFPKQVYGSTSI